MSSAIIKLTEGNIKNNSIRIREAAHLFPTDTTGGSSKETMAKTTSLGWDDGEPVKTDIDGAEQSATLFRCMGCMRC